MAGKTNRLLIGLQCGECKSSNYVTSKNKINTPDKLELKKFCKVCKKNTPHKEKQKLK
ncbi:TPA: 50S ribosomal protein L33 [candidate division WWE3 bacterium]|uniref:Large ribosomal subunit protein bL33 n=1 Tax=candidate division WWE3 bacterium TaxID=2053526 RepID=A0A351JTE4_UNCKA|nr:50S ribosomal protein L33 [candidate division WWE3 bacterium]